MPTLRIIIGDIIRVGEDAIVNARTLGCAGAAARPSSTIASPGVRTVWQWGAPDGPTAGDLPAHHVEQPVPGCRTQCVCRTQEQESVCPEQVGAAATSTVAMVGGALTHGRDGVVGERDQVEVIHADLRVRRRGAVRGFVGR